MSKFFVMGGSKYYPAPVSDAIGFFDSIDECLREILDVESKSDCGCGYYVIFASGVKTPYAFWGDHYALDYDLIADSKLITIDAYREGGKLEVLDNE